MGAWLVAKIGRPWVRDGTEQTDPVRRLGPEPVWFEKLDPARYEGSTEVGIVHKPEPSEAERKRLAAQPEDERIKELEAKNTELRPAQKAPPPPPPPEAEPSSPPDAARRSDVDSQMRDDTGAASGEAAASPTSDERGGFFSKRKK